MIPLPVISIMGLHGLLNENNIAFFQLTIIHTPCIFIKNVGLMFHYRVYGVLNKSCNLSRKYLDGPEQGCMHEKEVQMASPKLRLN